MKSSKNTHTMNSPIFYLVVKSQPTTDRLGREFFEHGLSESIVTARRYANCNGKESHTLYTLTTNDVWVDAQTGRPSFCHDMNSNPIWDREEFEESVCVRSLHG